MARKYNPDGSFNDYDENGKVIGGGLKGTEGLRDTSGSSNSGYESSMSSGLSNLKNYQKQQTMAQLDQQRQNALSNLKAEKATIEPVYQQKKTQAGVNARQAARSFDEYMAQRGGGGAKSGIAGQGALMNNLGYQNAYSALDQAEASALSDNARRVSDVENNYESNLTSANAGLEAQYLQAYLDQKNRDKAFGLQEAGLTGMYNDAPTLANQQYNSGLDQWREQFDYGKSRDTVADTQWGKQFDAGQSQTEFEQWLAKQQLALSQQSAARASSGSSSANLSAVKYQNELGAQQSLATSMQGLQSMASNGATRSDILKFINANAGDLQANGVPVQDLYNWAAKNFTWDKNGSGWYNTAEE
ncbi:hypothetical protein [Desulfosporosinus hippei]|uniref:Uncharacterized protein n=1 Tax=Desulfosporosinus hippei DSM 8344 TaxID=1121419 RepID=A0A1G7UID8_9FIRM|nr:hypothetical protein [Desulfosporosinus hippei]SDG47316.1 hypothetical protein SAMN05443529_103154 [Desulfosporosinus hippei DSM 8344]